jgi:fused signal recognition particle receptor
VANGPFEYLSQAGTHPNTFLLVLGPLALGFGIAAILMIALKFKRRRDQLDMEKELQVSAREMVLTPKGSSKQLVTSQPLEVSQSDVDEIKSADRVGLLSRFMNGLARTRDSFTTKLGEIFAGSVAINEQTLEKIHEALFRADVGVKTASKLVDGIKKNLQGQEASWEVVKQNIITSMSEIFAASDRPMNTMTSKPRVILIVGVNGVGKTTTIGKLAAAFKAEGQSVILGAADTFRAAAIDQLVIWGERNGVPVIKHGPGSDPAAVAYDAVQAAKARGFDTVIIDTAGRLHSKVDLMAELSKINKSIAKDLPGAPHETWIVLDATTGQNAIQQCKAFSEVTSVSGIIMTKLDGTAKGGVIVGIADQFQIPIRYIGIGEKASDLRAFKSDEFIKGIFL